MLFIITVSVNTLSVLIKNKSLSQAAIEREREFSDLAKGGIFLWQTDSSKFVRLKFNYKLVNRIDSKNNIFTIKSGSSFTYWEKSHQQDTLFCKSNSDTVTKYKLLYHLPTAGSNIDIIGQSQNLILIFAKSLFYTIAHPFFTMQKVSFKYWLLSKISF